MFTVSIPFKREILSEQSKWGQDDEVGLVSIPFKREILSEQTQRALIAARDVIVSIPFKREILSEHRLDARL